MEAVLQADASSVRVPRGGDRVYKDECVYSFQTPVSLADVMVTYCKNYPPSQESEGGLYVGLSSFTGLGPDYLDLHHRKTGETLYLHITRVQKVIHANRDTLNRGPYNQDTLN